MVVYIYADVCVYVWGEGKRMRETSRYNKCSKMLKIAESGKSILRERDSISTNSKSLRSLNK